MKDDKVSKLYYDVVKAYGLPVLNHHVIHAKIKALRSEIGEDSACYYLEKLLTRNLRKETGEFLPTLTSGLDIYTKRLKIIDYYRRNKLAPTWRPPDADELAEAEKLRQQQWKD